MNEAYPGERTETLCFAGLAAAMSVLYLVLYVVPYHQHLDQVTECTIELGGLTEANWSRCSEVAR